VRGIEEDCVAAMADPGWITGAPSLAPRPYHQRRRGGVAAALILLGVILVIAAAILFGPGGGGPLGTTRPGERTPAPGSGASNSPVTGGQVTVVGSAPSSWDPALIGDAGSAGVLTQVYESLTALDAQNRVQPALARSWSLDDGGRQLTFQLRPDLHFSDGSALTADDVRRSWLRVLDPAHPSPLASLLGDVAGANAYASGSASADQVGIEAKDAAVVVHFRRPASYFPAAAASPTLSVVPQSLESSPRPDLPANLVGSGGYVPQSQSATQIRLTANRFYWAGSPSIGTVTLVTSLEGASPVDRFQAGDVDYTGIFRDDASWIRYDRSLGPQLRHHDDLSVAYYGFTTTVPPFDKVDVRRAFAMAVDWHRLLRLDDSTSAEVTSLVPPGIAGRGSEDFSPKYDKEGAKAALARAGYPDGAGFPNVTLVSSGGTFEEAVAQGLEDVLNIKVAVEIMPFDEYSPRLATDPPGFWTLDWIADYPHPQDFLGLLLETGSTSNTGHWSNAEFDAAIDRAAATGDPTAQEAAYTDAQRIVKDQVPVIPVAYGSDWDLSRSGLLGAQQTGVGFIRFAGLAWDK
jgi:oligopeptide transport system substrate-binding protein